MDELNYYLDQKYQSYLTGKKDCNLLIWGNAVTPKLCTMIVGLEYDPLNVSVNHINSLFRQKINQDGYFKKMYDFGCNIASKGNIPFVILVFPSFRNKYENKWEATLSDYPLEKVNFFWIEKISSNNGLINGENLRKRIYSILGVNYTDSGTTKAKNKSIADYFQFWSRSFLSRRIVKLDIDGVYSNSTNGVLIEIKRSNKP